MTSLRHRAAAFAITALAVMTMAACTEAAPTDQADAEAALCDSLATFTTSLEEFRDLDPATASVEDVQAARGDIQEAWDAVRAAAADVPEADDAAVDAAWQEVATAIDDFEPDVAISEALVPLQEAAGEVQTARDEMRDGLGCE
jgi:hypothetical protein